VVEVAWAATTRDDLFEIHAFIARDSGRFADATVAKIRAATDRLAAFPESGTRPAEYPSGPYREVIVGAYRVLYRYPDDAGRVIIIAVVHGARALPDAIEGR
jgi:toxin ParE1/3/4